MKAAVLNKYGPPEVLHIEEVNKPAPKPNEVLIRVFAAGVNSADARIRGARFPKGLGFLARLAFGLFRPRVKILGNTFSGIIEEIGSEVKDFSIGDEVFGMNGIKMGTHAEFLTINENKAIVKKPENINHEEAAAISFGGTTALYFIRDKAKVKSGQTVLINGASGAVGNNAVQIAKYYGANITTVCSTDNVEFVKSLGADFVIDYKKEDLYSINKKYDVIMDTVGNISIDNGLKLLNNNGIFLLVVGSLGDLIKSNFITGDKKVLGGTASEKKKDLEFLSKLVSEGKLKVIIDKKFKLEEIVEAHKLVDSGHKRGNIVLKIN